MNTYKRKQQASAKKSAANRGLCTVLHDYERDYAKKLSQNASLNETIQKNSISPGRLNSKDQYHRSSHQKLCVIQPQGQGYAHDVNREAGSIEHEQFTFQHLGSNQNSSSNIRGFISNTSVEKIAPYAGREEAVRDAQQESGNVRCSFNSYKKSAKKKQCRRHDIEFEDSLAQSNSQISLQGEDHAGAFNYYRPKRRVSQSPTKSPIHRHQNNAASVPQRTQISTNSTVLYDSHMISMQTPNHHPPDKASSKHSPINERHLGRHNQSTAYQGVANGSGVMHDRGSYKNNDTLFSFNNASSSDLTKESLHNQYLKPSNSSKLKTGHANRSPDNLADYYFGAVEEKPKNEQRRKVDILNYGRAKRDEIIEKLQLESAKHFQAMQKTRAKSGGTLKSQKYSKNTFKLQSEPQIMATTESDQPDNQRKSVTCYDDDCHKKKGKQRTLAQRLYEQTKSSQAKIEPAQHGPYSNQNIAHKKMKGASVQHDLISEGSQGRIKNTMTTPKTRTSKAQRQSRQERSNRAAKGALNSVAAPLLMNQRQLTDDTLKGTRQAMATDPDYKNMNFRLDTRGSSLHCDHSDDRSATQESVKREIDLKKRRVELGNEYMNQGKKVSKVKKTQQQPVYDNSRAGSLNTTKKKGLRNTLKNYDWQTTYADGQGLIKLDRGDSQEHIGNQTQTIKEISEYEQVTWENTMPMVRIKGRECDSMAKKQNYQSKEFEMGHLNQSKSAICTQEKQAECKIKTASFGNELSLREFIQVPKVKSPENNNKSIKEKSKQKQKEQQKSLHREQQTHQSPQRRVHLTMGSNQKLKVVQSQQNGIHALSQEEQMQFLRDKLVAVMLGYKTRKIYHSNRIIKQYRYEFRDLIQFAYTLKQEMAMNEGKPGQETQVETTKQLLLQSLKDLISKRHQFSKYFNRLLENGTEWMTTSIHFAGDDTFTSPLRASTIIKSAKKQQLQTRSQFINAGAKANLNLTQKKQTATQDRSRQTVVAKKESTMPERPKPKLSVPSHFDNADGFRTKSQKRRDSQLGRRTRQQSQMTFGGPVTTNSRQEVLSFAEGNPRHDQQRATTEMSQLAEEDKPAKRHTFLKRGEKTRQVYDPQKAVMMDKLARRNKSVTERADPQQLTTPKSAQVSRPVSVSRHADYTPPRIDNNGFKRRNEGKGVQYSTLDGPRTPKTGGHMQRMKEIRQTYQSPYKQLVSMTASINGVVDQRGKNFLEINRDRVTSLADQRKKSTSSRRCRNDLMDTAQSLANVSNQIKSPKIINTIQVDDDRRESSATRDFVSKIPRLRCSLSRERCSAPGPRGFIPVLTKHSVNSQNITFEEENFGKNNQKKVNVNTRGSFNNYQKMSQFTSQKSESKEVPQRYGHDEKQSSHHTHCHVQPSKPQNRPGQFTRKQSGQSNPGHASQSNHQKTPSLQEMNEMIKKQNQQYIQQKLQVGRGDSQGTGHRRAGSNYRSMTSHTSAANLKDGDAQREENRKAALDCVRKTREGLSAPRIGLGDKFQSNARGATETVSDISKLTMQAQAKILQLSRSNCSKVSLRYQHEKTPSDISALSQTNNENRARASMSNNQQSPTRGTRTNFAFQNQKAATNVTSVDAAVSINIGQQSGNNTAAPPAHPYHTSGITLAPNRSSPLLHESAGAASSYRAYPQGTGPKCTSRHQTCKPSERDSIMDQASNLQQLLEKFSPLRGMTFENKYVNKKTQIEQERTQDGQMVETGYTQESVTQAHIATSSSEILHDRCSKEESPCAKKQMANEAHNETSQQYLVTEECSGNDGGGELTKLQLPSHNYCQMIGMFDQNHKCLDLGRSSNFDSISHTYTNLPSKRIDSPQQRQINMESSDCDDDKQSNNLVHVGSETLDKGEKEYPINGYGANHERRQRAGDSVHQAADQNYPGSQSAFAPPSSCSTSTFRLCPISIKNKSSMSSWQASSRQSARHEQQQYVHQFDSRNITFNHSHISLPTNIQSYQQEKSLGERRKGHGQLTVLCQDKDVQSGSAAILNNASRRSSPSRADQEASQQRRIKYSPLKDQSRQGHISPYRRSIQSPMKVDKENQLEEPAIYEHQEMGQYGHGAYLDGFEDQQRNHELTLMMPQILSGPTRTSVLDSRKHETTEQSLPETSEQNLTRRRRSRGDRSRAGNKSRRSTQVTNFTKSNLYLTALGEPQQPRGTLLDIGSSTQVNQSVTSQNFQEKPVFAVPEAQPTPQRPQIFSKECTEESPSFSPKKAHQFSAVTTPQNKTRIGNWGQAQNLSANKPAGASGSRQRLTQTKRSRECQQNQTRSPMKTPQRETRQYGRSNQADNMKNYRTGTHSQNSTQQQYNSSQKSMRGAVTPAGSGKKAIANMRPYQNGVRDFPSFNDAQQFQSYGYEPSKSVMEEITHLRN